LKNLDMKTREWIKIFSKTTTLEARSTKARG